MEECTISIPNPFAEDAVIDLYLTLSEDTKNNVVIVNGSPYISTKVKLTANILSSDKNSNYFNENNLILIEKYANSYLKGQFNSYLYKVSKEFGADIDLFGRYAVKYFKTWDEWLDYNWSDNYKNSFFDIEVDVNVSSSYLIS